MEYDGENLTVYGENLNEFGQLSINGGEYEKGTFTEEKTLVYTNVELKDSDVIVIGQIRGDSILSETSPVLYQEGTNEVTHISAFPDEERVGNVVNSFDVKAYLEEREKLESQESSEQE